MIIDLTKLLTNIVSSIKIEEEFNIDNEKIVNTNIRKLNNVMFKGKITNDFENKNILEGNINGIMVLCDDVTLEEFDYKFDTPIYEYLENSKIINNKIDITDILFENILVEVPLKIVKDNRKNINLHGDGWRLISEDEVNSISNNPFSELSKLLEK